MLQLLILRHASSSFAKSGQRDIERELNEAGKIEVTKVAQTIEKENLQPDFVYCSPATRTRQTLSAIEHAFTQKPEIDFRELLYACMNEDYFNLIKQHETPKDSKAQTLMIIGHNPMCAALTSFLVGSGQERAKLNWANGFKEGNIADIRFSCNAWQELEKASGHLARFESPYF
ncbi:MAG: histidine phosphatase family protein [Nitratireductor sp.]